MQTLIDKIQLAGTANIETAGFKTLLVVINNGTSAAANYTGSKAEADALKAIMEVVLTKALVASIALPESHTSVINMLTLPANSIV